MSAVFGDHLVLVLIPVLLLVFVVTLIEMIRHHRRGMPRLTSRPLPRIGGGSPPRPETTVVVAGRTYVVVDGSDPGEIPSDPCPWCLGPLDPAGGDEVIRCSHPQCRRAGHRRHVEEFGGCGGICSVLG